MSQLNYDAILAFGVFADHSNFTRAAEQLHISQPALHMKIQELSRSLGKPLYRKNGRQLELTETGKQVARFARELETHSSSFIRQIDTGDQRQQITVASGEGAYLYLLGDGIREYTKTSNKLKLLTLNREGIIDAVESGRADIGVSSLDHVPDGMTAKLLCRAHQVLVMPKAHPLVRKRSLQLSDLAGQSLIVPPADRPHRQMLSAILQSKSVSWQVAVEASGWELMTHFCKLGLGLTIINSTCKIPSGLVARPLTELPAIQYHIFHLTGTTNRAVQQFKQILLESCATK